MRNFAYKPRLLATRVRIGVLLALGCISPFACATFIDEDTELDRNSPADDYVVRNGATLTGRDAVLATARLHDAHLVLEGGAIINGRFTAIDLTNSTASLNRVYVSNKDLALRLQPDSTAQVTNSSLTGAAIGAQLATGTKLTMASTELIGTELTGIYMGGATVEATGGTIRGGEYGIVVEGLSPSDRGSLQLHGTHVAGGTGPAISVGYPGNEAKADIVLSDGATLTSGNGTLVDVVDGSEATLAVTGSTLEGNLAVGDGATFAATLGQGATLTGDVLASATASARLALSDGATFTGRLQTVSDLSIANGATWALVENARQENLTLDGGVVRLGDGDAHRTLTLHNLNGSGGRFDLYTNFATGETDFVDVTGTSSGNHVLNVASAGSDASQSQILVARTADGGADFSLLNGRVDLGTWSYQLASDDGKQWYLDGAERTISPGTASALALFNTAPTAWYGELTTLRGRMGELRWRTAAPGGWVRAYGSQANVQAAGIGYRQQQQGMTLGADAPLPWGDGQWLGGVLAGYSQSDVDLQRGTTGTVKSYYAGLYATWLDAGSGYYFDALAKANRFNNDADVALSDGGRTDGDYRNLGLGGAVEFGRHITLQDGWFLEPFGQLSMLVIQGKDFTLDNGLAIDGQRSRSLLGKVGTTVGRSLDLGKGRSMQPYVRAAVANEFAKRNDVAVNGNHFNNDSSGTRGEISLGLAVDFGNRLHANASFDYAKGDAFEQPWGISAGLRYNW